MSFPRIAIHTGNKIVATNKHPSWEGTVVLQHNETTATMLKYGPNMSSGAKVKHPILSTWQSDCRGRHWASYFSNDCFREDDSFTSLIFGQEVSDGQVVVPQGVTNTVAVAPAIAH